MYENAYDSAPEGLSAMGGTFAERAAYRAKSEKAAAKAVSGNDAEDKSVSSESTKSRRTTARKKA